MSDLVYKHLWTTLLREEAFLDPSQVNKCVLKTPPVIKAVGARMSLVHVPPLEKVVNEMLSCHRK